MAEKTSGDKAAATATATATKPAAKPASKPATPKKSTGGTGSKPAATPKPKAGTKPSTNGTGGSVEAVPVAPVETDPAILAAREAELKQVAAEEASKSPLSPEDKAAVKESWEAAAVNTAIPAAAVVAPAVVEVPKRVLDPREALDRTLTNAVKQVVGLQREVAECDRTRERSRQIMVRLGVDVPDDGADAGDAVPVKGGKKKPGPQPAATTAAATPATTTNGNGGGLWELIEDHLYRGGFIDPKFETSANLKALAEKNNYTTAANLLSQRQKAKHLAKGERGEYALPKGYKRG